MRLNESFDVFLSNFAQKIKKCWLHRCVRNWPRWFQWGIWAISIFLIFVAQRELFLDRFMISFYILPLLFGVVYLSVKADALLIVWCTGVTLFQNWERFSPISWAMLISIPLVLGTTSLVSRLFQRMLQRERILLQERERLYDQLVYAFAKTIEYKDSYTMGHSQRVAEYARLIARQMRLSEEARERIYIAGLLHDVGKVGVPESVLQKPGALTSVERAQIQEHVNLGVQILQGVEGFHDIVQMVEDHHERWDGTGYSGRKKMQDIHFGGRILAVADAYDAMTSMRVYREPIGSLEACVELIRCRETQFDPEIVDAFVALMGATNAQCFVAAGK